MAFVGLPVRLVPELGPDELRVRSGPFFGSVQMEAHLALVIEIEILGAVSLKILDFNGPGQGDLPLFQIKRRRWGQALVLAEQYPRHGDEKKRGQWGFHQGVPLWFDDFKDSLIVVPPLENAHENIPDRPFHTRQ